MTTLARQINSHAPIGETAAAGWEIRPAEVKDVPSIKALIDPHVETGIMLPKTLSALYESLRDFQVCVDGDRVIGAGALHVLWEDLAEIRSLGVHSDYHGRGIGKAVGKAVERKEGGPPRSVPRRGGLPTRREGSTERGAATSPRSHGGPQDQWSSRRAVRDARGGKGCWSP